jgi:aspartate racemase
MPSILGVVGGLGPEGTVHYYRKLAQHFSGALPVEARPGIVIDHVWMDGFVPLLRAEAEVEIQRLLAVSLQRLHQAGAELALVASVTPHLFLGPLRKTSPVELVDLVEATQGELIAAGYRTVGLLGTRLTLTRPFFKSGLEQAGIRVVVPDEGGIAYLDGLIFGPLAAGKKTPEMRQELGELISTLAAEAKLDALVVACTDLMDLIESTTVLVDPIDSHIRLAARRLAARQAKAGALGR